jgi:hypothetical protein
LIPVLQLALRVFSGPLRRPIAAGDFGEIPGLKFAGDLGEAECKGRAPTVYTVQEMELCRAWLVEGLDGWDVVTITESLKDPPENSLIELAALGDDHIAQRNVERGRIGASVARGARRPAYKSALGEQLVRNRKKSWWSIRGRIHAGIFLLAGKSIKSSIGRDGGRDR